MKNPWEAVPLKAYEAHMGAPQVGQLQALSEITGRQLARHKPLTVCVLGIAGGNGLEHIDPAATEKVYGIDISAEYLKTCAKRFAALGDTLTLLQMDLCAETAHLPKCDLVIANLIIEYTGINIFTRLIAAAHPAAGCCVVQVSFGAAFVSETPSAAALRRIGDIHEDIEPEKLTAAMKRIGYVRTFSEEYPLPNDKKLVCIDFAG